MAGGGGAAPGPEDTGSSSGTNVFGEAPPASVDLNLTALMDILSNLLFFLLASFGATIVMSINTTVPTQSEGKTDVADTQQSITLNVTLTKTQLEISATGTQQSEAELAPLRKTIAHKGDEPNFAALTDHLYDVKQKFPRSDTMILMPEPGVRYDTMIRVMDAAREKNVRVGLTASVVPLFPSVVVSTMVK